MSNKIVKSTYLEGYYATGDNECFCFDTHKGPTEHRTARGDLLHSDNEEDPDACRTYPGELLDREMMGKKGRWTITIEFEPYETAPKN